jgi:hypothetical protein
MKGNMSEGRGRLFRTRKSVWSGRRDEDFEGEWSGWLSGKRTAEVRLLIH